MPQQFSLAKTFRAKFAANDCVTPRDAAFCLQRFRGVTAVFLRTVATLVSENITPPLNLKQGEEACSSLKPLQGTSVQVFTAAERCASQSEKERTPHFSSNREITCQLMLFPCYAVMILFLKKSTYLYRSQNCNA